MRIPISPNIRFQKPPIRPKYGLLNLFKENSNNYIKNISYKKKISSLEIIIIDR